MKPGPPWPCFLNTFNNSERYTPRSKDMKLRKPTCLYFLLIFFLLTELGNTLNFKALKEGFGVQVGLKYEGRIFPQDDNNIFGEDPIKFIPVSSDSDFSPSIITCMLQDSEGFIWVGTIDGLYLHDGFTFKSFKNDPDNPETLSHNYVTSIIEDMRGIVWVGTVAGLNRIEGKKCKIRKYHHSPKNTNSLCSDMISSLYEDCRGHIWIGTVNHGLCRLVLHDDYEKQPAFKRYCHDPRNPSSLSDNRVFTVCEDGLRNLWIGTQNGLDRLQQEQINREHPVFDHQPLNFNDLDGQNKNAINVIYQDSTGDLWVGAEQGGLTRIILRGNKKQQPVLKTYHHDPGNPASLSSNSILALCEDRLGSLWIGTVTGLNRLLLKEKDKERPFFMKYLHNPLNKYSVVNDFIYSILEDSSSVIWIGTRQGLCKFNPRGKGFLHFYHDPNNPHSLSHNVVYSILEDTAGYLWLGTQNGLNRFDHERNQFHRYLFTPKIQDRKESFIFSLLESNPGIFWIGNFEGLACFNTINGHLTSLHFKETDSSNISAGNIINLYKDIQGNIWIGTSGYGLYRYDKQNKTYGHFTHDPDDPFSLRDDYVICIYEDSKGFLWIGTAQGLSQFDKRNGQFTHFTYNPRDPFSISNDLVSAICEDSGGFIWVGTVGGGINRLKRETGKFTRYSERNGLANNNVFNVLEDDSGCIWMSTSNGISIFDPAKEEFRNYNRNDGLQEGEFSLVAGVKRRNGKLVFGGVNGFTIINPGKININQHVPPIYISDILPSNKSVREKSKNSPRKPIIEAKEISLSYKENDIFIQFVALDYQNPKMNHYAYMMEGLSDEWIYLGNERSVVIENLSPGRYIFRVKGSNSDGMWNEEGTFVKIIIQSPFWHSGWFIGLVTVIIVGMSMLSILFVKRYRSRQSEEESELERISSQFGLTNREKEILKLMIKGKRNKDIEEELFISKSTVKNHIHNIYEKMNVKSRLELLNLIQKSNLKRNN